MSEHSKDQFVNYVTNQRGYSWLLTFFSMPDQLLLFCFFCMHIHATVYQCTLNVFAFCHSAIYTPIVLTLFPQHSLQLTSHTVSLKSEEAYAVEAWYMPECLYWHWENNDQNVFMGWYSMVYYLSNTVCVFYFPRSWWEWLAGVFIKSLNLCSVYEISITLTNLTGFFFVLFCFFLSLCCWSVLFPWSVFGYVSTVLRHVALQAFSWDTTRVVLLENTWVEIQLTTFSLWFNQMKKSTK